MADNNTQVRASTQVTESEAQLIVSRHMVVTYSSCALTTVPLIYGVISWCVLKQFRNYRNFVFLNVILENLLNNLTTMFCRYILYTPVINVESLAYQQFSVLTYFIYLYAGTVKTHWLIVVCHMFYVDIVKVFNGHIERRHFKSVLFAWGLPFVTSLVYTYVTTVAFNLKESSSIEDITYFYFLLPLFLNTLLYIVIVCTLFRSSNMSSHSTSSKWHHFIATLIFLLSDCLIFSSQVLRFFSFNATTVLLENLIVAIINPLLIYVYFIVVKRNRVLWYEFYVNKLNKRRRNRDIKMEIKGVRPTTDRRPAVTNVQC